MLLQIDCFNRRYVLLTRIVDSAHRLLNNFWFYKYPAWHSTDQIFFCRAEIKALSFLAINSAHWYWLLLLFTLLSYNKNRLMSNYRKMTIISIIHGAASPNNRRRKGMQSLTNSKILESIHRIIAPILKFSEDRRGYYFLLFYCHWPDKLLGLSTAKSRVTDAKGLPPQLVPV